MPKIHKGQSYKGSFLRCASLQDTESLGASGRGLLLPAAAGVEQMDGRRARAELQWLLNLAAAWGRALPPAGLQPPAAAWPSWKGSAQLQVAPSHLAHLSGEDIPPALVWLWGTGSTRAQQSCKIGVAREGQRDREHLVSAFPFCHWLLSPPLPQVSLIRTSTVPTASVLVWADIQHRLADPKRHLTHSWRCERNNQAESFHHPWGTRGDTIDLPRNMQGHPQTFHDHLLWVCFVIKQPCVLALAGKLKVQLFRGDLCLDFLII